MEGVKRLYKGLTAFSKAGQGEGGRKTPGAGTGQSTPLIFPTSFWMTLSRVSTHHYLLSECKSVAPLTWVLNVFHVFQNSSQFHSTQAFGRHFMTSGRTVP